MLHLLLFFCVWICLARPPDQDFAGLINWNRGLAEFVSATFFEKCSVKGIRWARSLLGARAHAGMRI